MNLCDWAPNESRPVRKAIRVKEGRYYKNAGFKMRRCCAEDLQDIVVPFLHYQEVPENENNMIFDFRCAYFLTCLVEEP